MPKIHDLWQDLRFGLRILLMRPGITLISILTPARRATKVDPIIALRSE